MRMVVWKIPLTTTESEIRQLFEVYGAVERVTIIRDPERRKAHAYVDMPHHREGLAAMKGTIGATLGGKPVSVQRDTTLERAAAMVFLAEHEKRWLGKPLPGRCSKKPT